MNYFNVTDPFFKVAEITPQLYRVTATFTDGVFVGRAYATTPQAAITLVVQDARMLNPALEGELLRADYEVV